MKRKPKWVKKEGGDANGAREPADKRPTDMGKTPARSFAERRRAILSHKTSSKD